MIHVDALTVHEFRGIRHIDLSFDRKNFAVCGPNGSGKSGIVDALEFVLTGTVSRLSGPGRGELSVKEHGPHVDCQLPEQAYAEATVWVPELRKSLTIRRTVKAPKSPTLKPDTPEMRGVVAFLQEHPEYVLSRREITNYVLSEPSKRAVDVQALLKLEKINDLRLKFQKISRSEAAVEKQCALALKAAEVALARALQVQKTDSTTILDAINGQRAVLGMKPLDRLGAEPIKAAGMVPEGEASPIVATINKTIALSEISALQLALTARRNESFQNSIRLAFEKIGQLEADVALLNAITRDDFLKTALELFDGEECPACESSFTTDQYAQIINRKRAKLAAVKDVRAEAEKHLNVVLDSLQAELDLLRPAWSIAKALMPAEDVQKLTDAGQTIPTEIAQLQAFLPLGRTLQALHDLSLGRPYFNVIERLAESVRALPEPSAQHAASEILTIAQERLDTLDDAKTAHDKAALHAKQALKVLQIYLTQTQSALGEIYDKVQKRFSALYALLNSEDESAFQAEMRQDGAGLGLRVDFYSRGNYPPGAFHSEGHQDSMGLCLYLALMEHLQGSRFTFAVLDDVLMSVDAGHRREVSKLLRTEFPNTQFVLTTHDPVWLKFMQTTSLIEAKRAVRFRKWTVEGGPSVWRGADIWQEIGEAIKNDRILEAASGLRNYLEYIASEACQALRASVAFSADGRYDLEELLQPALNRLREHLRDAAKAAETWKNADKLAEIAGRVKQLETAVALTQIDRWQINPAIHYNSWAQFDRRDFEHVVTAFRALIATFHCGECNAMFEIVPPRGSREHLVCACGKSTLSFARKAD